MLGSIDGNDDAKLDMSWSADEITASQEHPVIRGHLALFCGDIFVNQHYAEQRYRWDQACRTSEEADVAALRASLQHQPWLEWDASKRCFTLQTDGAQDRLRSNLGAVRLHRATGLHEARVLMAARDLTAGSVSLSRQREIGRGLGAVSNRWSMTAECKRQLTQWVERLGRREPLSEDERQRLAGFTALLPHQANPLPTLFAMPKASMDAMRSKNTREAVIEISVDLQALPEDVRAGIYLGVEHNFVEVAFISDAARCHAASAIKGIVYYPSLENCGHLTRDANLKSPSVP